MQLMNSHKMDPKNVTAAHIKKQSITNDLDIGNVNMTLPTLPSLPRLTSVLTPKPSIHSACF